MTGLIACRNCGALIPHERGELCSRCRDLDSVALDKVKDYLDYHPAATAEKVAEKTGIEAERVLRFAREGALSTVEYINIRIPCEQCGAMITSGRFCKRCADRLAGGLERAVKKIRGSKESK